MTKLRLQKWHFPKVTKMESIIGHGIDCNAVWALIERPEAHTQQKLIQVLPPPLDQVPCPQQDLLRQPPPPPPPFSSGKSPGNEVEPCCKMFYFKTYSQGRSSVLPKIPLMN